MLTTQDLLLLSEKKITSEQIDEQLNAFRVGYPYLPIVASASAGKGIRIVGKEEMAYYHKVWNEFLGNADSGRIVKFVPASGAASRMFKDLYEFIAAEYDTPQTDFEKTFFDKIKDFAFFGKLNSACIANEGNSIDELIRAGQYKPIVENLLSPQGLNYGNLPKGLILFHKYNETARTAMEEHLVEGALYTRGSAGGVDLHFTVSAEHKDLFEALVKSKAPHYEEALDVQYNISFSVQKPSTDTIAADANNQPFRENGSLVFRPGGHGALIENLNDIDAGVIFIKNIDNVLPDRLKPSTTEYKRLIGGVLIDVQKKIHTYIRAIDSGKYRSEDIVEIFRFLQDELCINTSEIDPNPLSPDTIAFIRGKLDRPIRVCGMVRNLGEPGGGPFIAVNADGTSSPQILESSQIDMQNPAMRKLFESGTHFNPVDLVCAVSDHKGRHFDLLRHVDRNTGFISIKSKSGKELKALELPGLWNGAMSDWNTIFVEVPVDTFNPVKTVNDLLKEEHK